MILGQGTTLPVLAIVGNRLGETASQVARPGDFRYDWGCCHGGRHRTMTLDDRNRQGPFSAALVGEAEIRRFMERQIRPLKDEEEALSKPWRSGFRGKLPFFGLLDIRQKEHLRGIFAHMLPGPEVEVGAFDREERILLDVLAETYITQARVFVELMGKHEYRVTGQVKRDTPGRIIALTLSASVFVLDAPDAEQRRRYRYQNIYGNKHVTPEGRCRLKGHMRLEETLRAEEFRSSPLLMLAIHPEGSDYRMEFRQESKVVSDTMTSKMREVTFHASSSFSAYTNVRPLAEVRAEGDEEPDGGGNGARSSTPGNDATEDPDLT